MKGGSQQLSTPPTRPGCPAPLRGPDIHDVICPPHPGVEQPMTRRQAHNQGWRPRTPILTQENLMAAPLFEGGVGCCSSVKGDLEPQDAHRERDRRKRATWGSHTNQQRRPHSSIPQIALQHQEHCFGRLHSMDWRLGRLGGTGAYRATQSAGGDIPRSAAAAHWAVGPQPTRPKSPGAVRSFHEAQPRGIKLLEAEEVPEHTTHRGRAEIKSARGLSRHHR